MNNPKLLENLRVIYDFPKPGIQFQDVTTLFKNPECLRIMRDEIVELYKDKGITKVVGIESRGFMLAGVTAVELGAGAVLCRKPGKLPGETISESYERNTERTQSRFTKVPSTKTMLCLSMTTSLQPEAACVRLTTL